MPKSHRLPLCALLLSLAFVTGMALQRMAASGAAWLTPAESGEAAQPTTGLSAAEVVGSFPLFIYTLFGGLIVRRCRTGYSLLHCGGEFARSTTGCRGTACHCSSAS